MINRLKPLKFKYIVMGGIALVVLLGSAGAVMLQSAKDTKPTPATVGNSKGTRATNDNTSPQTAANQTSGSSGNASLDTGSTSAPTGQSPSSGQKPSSNSGSPSTNPPGNTPAPDTAPPSVPESFTVIDDPDNQFHRVLSWNASTDNAGVVGYYLYLGYSESDVTNQQPFHNVNDGSTDDTDVTPICSPHGFYTYYAVRAYDAAGNLSDPAIASIRDNPGHYCNPIGT